MSYNKNKFRIFINFIPQIEKKINWIFKEAGNMAGEGGKMKPEILFLNQEDVINAGALDMKMVLEQAEKTLVMWAKKEIINPTKVGMVLPEPEKEQSFFISMPSYIGGKTDVAGFKWAAESRENIADPQLPTGIDITILSDPHTALPIAILDGTLITAMRTAASAGVAAKYLARRGTKRVCFVGAGTIGRTMVMAMKNTLDSLEEIELFDLDYEKALRLAGEFKGEVDIRAVSELEPAVRSADMVVTMTSTRKPYLKSEWLRKDATVIQMGPNEVEPAVILGADVLLVDNWEQLTHSRLSAVQKLYMEGKLKQKDATELKEVIVGNRAGRDSDSQQIVYCSLGLGAMDIVIAERLYQTARARGIGQTLYLWDKPRWI